MSQTSRNMRVMSDAQFPYIQAIKQCMDIRVKSHHILKTMDVGTIQFANNLPITKTIYDSPQLSSVFQLYTEKFLMNG